MQKLAEICIRRPVFATMLIMALVVVGGFCYTRLGVDLFPKVDSPTVTVTTVLPGASPDNRDRIRIARSGTQPRIVRWTYRAFRSWY